MNWIHLFFNLEAKPFNLRHRCKHSQTSILSIIRHWIILSDLMIGDLCRSMQSHKFLQQRNHLPSIVYIIEVIQRTASFVLMISTTHALDLQSRLQTNTLIGYTLFTGKGGKVNVKTNLNIMYICCPSLCCMQSLKRNRGLEIKRKKTKEGGWSVENIYKSDNILRI